jgi:hypothetical protein
VRIVLVDWSYFLETACWQVLKPLMLDAEAPYYTTARELMSAINRVAAK